MLIFILTALYEKFLNLFSIRNVRLDFSIRLKNVLSLDRVEKSADGIYFHVTLHVSELHVTLVYV